MFNKIISLLFSNHYGILQYRFKKKGILYSLKTNLIKVACFIFVFVKFCNVQFDFLYLQFANVQDYYKYA